MREKHFPFRLTNSGKEYLAVHESTSGRRAPPPTRPKTFSETAALVFATPGAAFADSEKSAAHAAAFRFFQDGESGCIGGIFVFRG
jgi:hypothetical protein